MASEETQNAEEQLTTAVKSPEDEETAETELKRRNGIVIPSSGR